MQFTWVPFYRELAEKLLPYANRSGELVDILEEAISDTGLSAGWLQDQDADDQKLKLSEIDPFTFFAAFNRGVSNTKRTQILGTLKRQFAIAAAVPDDFDGIPVMNNLNSLFCGWKVTRAPNQIANLWKLAQECVDGDPDTMTPELYAMGAEYVGAQKMTAGLFWLNPEKYLAFDSLMADYVKDRGISIGKIKSYDKYREAVAKIKAALGADYPQISRDAYLFANKLPVGGDSLESGLLKLLEAQAEKNDLSVGEVVHQLAIAPDGGEEENEVTNRLRVLPEIGAALSEPLDSDAFKKLLPELWVFCYGQDSIRRNAFLDSGLAADAIADLLDATGGVDVLARIDAFVELATTNGYATPNGRADFAGAAQFASVLLSATRPDQFVDFRENRWNKLFSLITESSKRLGTSSSYGWKLVRAGKFAAELSATETFKKYFGQENGPWKVAGLAWAFKEGLFDMTNEKTKQYWAGGFLWGTDDGKGESHLDEFLEGDLWRAGYSRDNPGKKHVAYWAMFDQIKVGDEFAIKGYGGRNDLKIYYVGSVAEIISDEGIIRMEKLERKLFHGKAPSVGGGGNWFGTIVPVVNPDAIREVFHGESVVSTPVKAPIDLPSKNVILYGPPGTGKTYALRTRYMEHFTDYKSAKTREEHADELVADMAWWEVITMVMLDLGAAKVSEILRHPLLQARVRRSENRTPRAAIWAHIQMHTKRDCEHVAYSKRYEPLLFTKSEQSVWSIDEELAREEVAELAEKLDAFKAYTPSEATTTKRYAFTTFHQSFSYEDFIEGIKPVMGEDMAGELSYEILPGAFRQIAQRAKSDPEHDYAIFIDEINRGNVANIFGELITLLEDDKRLGEAHSLEATLPYSRDQFGVPANLYVVGTMNTADRSIEALDTALRRRFTFIECAPDPELLKLEQPDDLDVNLETLLKTINARIERLLDADHCIGHSYFMGLTHDGKSGLDGLRHAFANKIVPLLEEYFYGDPAKIGMVLGEKFVKQKDGQAPFAGGDWGYDEFEDRMIFEIVDPMGLTEEDFLSIYA